MAKLGPDNRTGYKNVAVIEGYDHWASTYERESNPLILLEENVTLELVGDVQGQRILDIGCGTGRYCVLLAERGATVVGLDPSQGMLEQAKQKVTTTCFFELHHGTIETTDFPTDHFDLVVSALTMSHLPELEPTLSEAVRVLKSGGCLVISDIHPYWPVSGHNYTEFFDETGQEYRIPEYSHLVEEYWYLLNRLSMRLEDIREPKIDNRLIEHFPSLQDYQGIPLAMVFKARKSSLSTA
jgi:malonyl-CoA O-methyltransferase